MNKRKIILEIENYLKKRFKGEATGHDYWHAMRVKKLAKKIAKKEGGDLFIIELGALLHDVDDWKFNGGKIEQGSKIAAQLLKKLKAEEEIIKKICQIIESISFKGAGVKNGIVLKEAKIVFDADKIDSIGAIGIARALAYGGYKGREIYNPEIKPIKHKSFSDYKKSKGTSINHFYEKLLLLKERLETKTGKQIAKERHKFLENYLKQFFEEWDA